MTTLADAILALPTAAPAAIIRTATYADATEDLAETVAAHAMTLRRVVIARDDEDAWIASRAIDRALNAWTVARALSGGGV